MRNFSFFRLVPYAQGVIEIPQTTCFSWNTSFIFSISDFLYASINYAWHWWEGRFLLYTFSNGFQGVLLVFEYAWFLLQQTKNAGNYPALIDVAIKAYQTSEIQTTVFNDLQHAIEESSDNHDILTNAILGITHKCRMCKPWILIKPKVWSV